MVLWEVTSRHPVAKLSGGHQSWINSVAFSPDDKLVASAGVEATVILWDVAGRRRIAEPLIGHERMVTSVAFSPDGKLLASADNKTVIVWDLESAQRLDTVTGFLGECPALPLVLIADSRFSLWQIGTASRY